MKVVNINIIYQLVRDNIFIFSMSTQKAFSNYFVCIKKYFYSFTKIINGICVIL